MVLAKKCRKVVVEMSMDNTMAYPWTPGAEPATADAGIPRAVFIPHANSLPFEERRVSLEQPVKIGRNVYRALPSPTNTIFECRVLSRHHATLWYDKGHFYIMDNHSSNGTFINNNRTNISKNSEPQEVFSGDVVQFGIAVVENQGNAEKNTFPPVVAFLKLYHPDGKEAIIQFNPTMTTPLHLKELYQLNNFVQEAIGREAALESKLRNLRECVERTRGEAQSSWELLVGEQRLLARVHALEGVLAAGKQPEPQQVTQLLEDKRNYQEVARESLRAAHEQRLALEQALERRLREAASLHQHNCALRLAANNALAELQKLASRCERKMCAARLAIVAAEEREAAARANLPLTYSVMNGEARMLVLSGDSNRLVEEAETGAADSLEDAVHALPDYIKLLLPQHLLTKVGIKSVSSDGKSAKEFELILKKNEEYEAENEGKRVSVENTCEGDEEEKSRSETDPSSADTSTDDEKNSRMNHDTSLSSDVSSVTVTGELPDNHPDNNANSTYADTGNNSDSENKGPPEYANILRVMAGLNDEIKGLRERLNASNSENEKLRTVRDELLAVKLEIHEEAEQQAEAEAEDATSYEDRLADLQAQLAKSAAVEEANLVEIQRLASTAAELEAELAFRPTQPEVIELTATISKLREEIVNKDEFLENLQARLRAIEGVTLDGVEKPDGSEKRPEDDVIDSIAQIDKVIEELDFDEDFCKNDYTEVSSEKLRKDTSLVTTSIDKSVSTESYEELYEKIRGEFDKEHLPTITLTNGLDSVVNDTKISLNQSLGKVNHIGEIKASFNAPDVKDDDKHAQMNDETSVCENTESSSSTDAPSESMELSTYVKLDDADRLQVTLQNGTLHALEEELVRYKERYAEVVADNARFAAKLETLSTKPEPQKTVVFALAAVIPVFLGIFIMFYSYIS